MTDPANALNEKLIWGFSKKDCFFWPGSKDKDGYGQINAGGKVQKAHKYAYEKYYRRTVPKGMVLRHTCNQGHLGCCNPHHLVLGTQAENVQDIADAGHTAWGERHGQSKLTTAAVDEIRNTLEDSAVLAKKYGVDRSTINRVRRGAAWLPPKVSETETEEL